MTVSHRRRARRTLAAALCAAVLAAPPALFFPSPALAQTAGTESRRLQFDIAAGDLDQVLNRFAVAAGLELSINAGLTAG